VSAGGPASAPIGPVADFALYSYRPSSAGLPYPASGEGGAIEFAGELSG
jgi:hypothetical protein